MKKFMITIVILSAISLLSCTPGSVVTGAAARIIPTSGNDASGIVTFQQEGNMVTITGEITGLAPGNHGFHIHEKGDMTEMDGTSAGGHYNPLEVDHGRPSDRIRHIGDLGNITADNNGRAVIDKTDTVIRLNGIYSIIGRAVVVHADPDDFSQPTGNAGPRVGFGVIGIVTEE